MRLFIAATIPAEVLERLNERIARFKSRLPHASWVKPSSQHLTLAFLGDQPRALAEQLAQPLSAALATIPRFEASLHGCGFFPNSRHARVGWIGLAPERPFVETAAVVREVLRIQGVPLDSDFKPHLTLMRLRNPWPPASVDLFSTMLHDHQSSPFAVGSVTIFSSKLDPKGAIHTPMRTIELGKDRPHPPSP